MRQPGKQLGECVQFLQVTEMDYTVEHIGLADDDIKHICVIKGTNGKSFCLVITSVRGETPRSECQEFDLLDLRIIHFRYPEWLIDIVVSRNGNVRWYLDCELHNYQEVRRFYLLMRYDKPERNLRVIMPIFRDPSTSFYVCNIRSWLRATGPARGGRLTQTNQSQIQLRTLRNRTADTCGRKLRTVEFHTHS